MGGGGQRVVHCWREETLETKSTSEKEEEEDSGGSIWQNMKADIKAKQETSALTKPAPFSAEGRKKEAHWRFCSVCMDVRFNLQNWYDPRWPLEQAVPIFTYLLGSLENSKSISVLILTPNALSMYCLNDVRSKKPNYLHLQLLIWEDLLQDSTVEKLVWDFC